MKVYVVEFGEYSSRYVSGVYSTEENAAIATQGGGDIEEFELDPMVDEFRAGMRSFRVQMDKDGNVNKVDNWGYSPHRGPEFKVNLSYPLGVRPAAIHFEGTLWAKDETQAIKATNERRAKAIASGEWDEREAEIRALDERFGKARKGEK